MLENPLSERGERIKKFIQKEMREALTRIEILPPVLRMWVEEFPPALADELTKMLGEKPTLNIQFTGLHRSGEEVRIALMEGESEENQEQRWKVVHSNWIAKFEVIIFSPIRLRGRIDFYHSVISHVLLAYYGDDVMEVTSVKPRRVNVYGIVATIGGNSYKLADPSHFLATSEGTTQGFSLDANALREIADSIMAAVSCEVEGIKQWLWEIGKEIVDRLSERIRGLEIDFPPAEDGKLRIERIEILPLANNANIQYSRIKQFGTTNEKTAFEIKHPIVVSTKEKLDLEGDIHIRVAFINPIELTKQPTPTKVRLETVFLKMWLLMNTLHIGALASFKKEAIKRNTQLPPAKELVDDEVIEDIMRDLERQIKLLRLR